MSPPDISVHATCQQFSKAVESVRELDRERFSDSPVMRKHNQMIDLVCQNMLAGQDAFHGIGQFIEGEADA